MAGLEVRGQEVQPLAQREVTASPPAGGFQRKLINIAAGALRP